MLKSETQFEIINAKLPAGCYDLGFVPLLNQNEMLLLGGYSDESKTLS